MKKEEVLKELGKLDRATLEVILDRVNTEWQEWLAFPVKERANRVRKTGVLNMVMAVGVLQYGKDAAKKIFPEFIGEGSVVAMAKVMEVDRSMLQMCLGATGTRKNLPLKKKMDDFMQLTPGTANRLLTELETL